MKIPTFRNLGRALVAVGIGTAMVSGPCLSEYPDRPITLMVGYKAAAGTYTVGRGLA